MLRRVTGVIYAVLALAFGLFALLLFITDFTRWRGLLFALVFALGAVVAFRSSRDAFTGARRVRPD